MGQDTIDYIKNSPRMNFEEAKLSYFEKLKEALLASNSITICRLLGKSDYSIRQLFDKHEPGW